MHFSSAHDKPTPPAKERLCKYQTYSTSSIGSLKYNTDRESRNTEDTWLKGTV